MTALASAQKRGCRNVDSPVSATNANAPIRTVTANEACPPAKSRRTGYRARPYSMTNSGESRRMWNHVSPPNCSSVGKFLAN